MRKFLRAPAICAPILATALLGLLVAGSPAQAAASGSYALHQGKHHRPVVTTDAASLVTSSSATLNGSVNPGGASTTYQFDYGTTTSYGTAVPVPAGSAGAGSAAVSESAVLTGLTASTTYHYRIEATNSAGTSYGSDQTFTTSADSGGGSPPNVDNAVADANWMMGAVITSGPMAGAIASYPDQQHIRPYQASYAAIGLDRATQVSGDATYSNAAWNYLSWYAANMDANGYAHDWDLTNGVWTEGGYDSTDAYAGMFLAAVRATYEVQPDSAKLSALHTAVSQAVAAIHSTQQSDGLTWAVPSGYPVKLLEDNVEMYDGLNAAVTVANELGDSALVSTAQSYAAPVPASLESLWNVGQGWYYWALDNNGVLTPTNWANLSPDTMEQGWAVAFGITESYSGRSSLILSEITQHQPSWDQPGATGNNYDVTPMGWGWYENGDATSALNAAASLRSAAVAANRAWPFTVHDCGSLIILETNGESLVLS